MRGCLFLVFHIHSSAEQAKHCRNTTNILCVFVPAIRRKSYVVRIGVHCFDVWWAKPHSLKPHFPCNLHDCKARGGGGGGGGKIGLYSNIGFVDCNLSFFLLSFWGLKDLCITKLVYHSNTSVLYQHWDLMWKSCAVVSAGLNFAPAEKFVPIQCHDLNFCTRDLVHLTHQCPPDLHLSNRKGCYGVHESTLLDMKRIQKTRF